MAVKYWPLRRGFIITSPFGERWGTTHLGTDFGWPGGSANQPVHAVKAGTVVNAGRASGFGRWVVLDHPADVDGGTTVYGHIIPEVTVGQYVDAGQRIARVNPDPTTNGGVAPHCHVEWHRRVWSPPGPDRLNPETMLAGAVYPDDNTEDPTVQWGIDVSNHQGSFDFAAARAEGFTWATHKVTEGAGYRDPYWPRARDHMHENFPGTFGGYVFCRTASHPEAEADTLLAHLGDTSIPIQVDYEDTTGGGSVDDLWARIHAIQARGMRVFSVYLPRWFWSSRMGSAPLGPIPPLWNSHYVTGTDYASRLYPGDHFAGWAPFADGTPVTLLQFTETARVAGQTIDANAYRGSADDLRALFAGAPTTPTTEEDDMTPEQNAMLTTVFNELTKRFPSRSRYRAGDNPIDTLAGMLLNVDARAHESMVERSALLGNEDSIDLVRAAAERGDHIAQTVLDHIDGKA